MDLQLIGITITVILAWSGLLIGVIKWLLDRYQSHIDRRFSALEEVNKAEVREWQRIERELLDLKVDLPMNYVRREDNIRQEVTINAKLDALAKKIDVFGRH